MLRLLLSKLLPFAFSIPAGLAAARAAPPGTQAPRTAMRDALRAADATTRNLCIVAVLLLAAAAAAVAHVSTGLALQQCFAAGVLAALTVLVLGGLAQQLKTVQGTIGQRKAAG